MMSGTGETIDSPQRTPDPGRKGIWTVALTPEFGVGTASSLRVTVLLFGGLILTVIISMSLAMAISAFTTIDGEYAFVLVVISVVSLMLLTSGVALSRTRKRWTSLSTPDGVRRAIEKRGGQWSLNAHDRANGAVRSVWQPFRRARWEQLPAAARAFDLPPPRALVIDPAERFKSLPREFSPDLLEPEDVGRHAFGAAAKSRALSLGAIITLLAFALYLGPMILRGGFGFRPEIVVAVGVALAIWLYGVFSPARGRWIPGVADSVLAAPSLVVLRSLRNITVFRASDSVLVLSRERQTVRDSRVVITRDDGKRVVLRFAGPEDERLQTLWTMWNHPRACSWDGDEAQVVPERAP